MQTHKLFLAFILLTLSSLSISAQNNTNSPYTRFGYGDISEGTAIELKGMGGVGLANRSFNTINSANPASYTSVDSLSFMFDVGTGARYSRFSDTKSSNNTFNANLEYITMRFPLSKWMAVSAGMLPYSLVGYNFSQSDSLSIPSETGKKISYAQSFSGAGGFSQIYGGLSLKFFNHIAIGANAYYVFGETSNYNVQSFGSTSYNSSVYTNQIKASDLKLRYGLQAFNTFAKKHEIAIGLIYENKNNLDGNFTATLNSDTIRSVSGFELPQTLGGGIAYTYNKKLTLGVDYTRQNWGDALYFNKKDSLVNTSKLAVGLEYIPDPAGRTKYSDLIRYRVGFNTSNQYYKVRGNEQPRNFVFSVGVGLPTRTGKSMMNIALEYGKIGSASLLREDYVKLSFAASINEFWFFKPKL